MRGRVLFSCSVLVTAVMCLVSQSKPVVGSDCPLDLGWSNLTSAASACSDPNERAKCCRYINALIAVSVARYADSTGQLGVPIAFSDMCINYVSETLGQHGISSNAMLFCGLGSKILVNYQCTGKTTVLEMLQAPNFTDVVNNCKTPLSVDNICRRCLNSAILYLHHIIGAEDNITLSTCRNAAFVGLANGGDQVSTIDIASCLFGIQGLGVIDVNISGRPPLQSPKAPPNPALVEAPSRNVIGIAIKEEHHPHHLTLIEGVGIGVTAAAILLIVVFILLIRKKGRLLKAIASPTRTPSPVFPPSARRCQEGPPSMFKRFGYKEIKKATSNFSSVLGRGGFGTVYKAKFADAFAAAVKRMDNISRQGEDEFCREIELIGRLHHRHLVALKGFCVDKHGRFLVYEYMENGSLKDHLHSSGKTTLSWATRLRIAIDVANALEYLHFYCDPPLCHRDIKSSNILLDENFLAKVADFGLVHASRSGSIVFEPINTNIRGTPGYMDPEYVVTQELTDKSDVYSYGVLLLELVTGRRAIQDNSNLVEWSQKFMGTDSQLLQLVDPLIANSFHFEQLQVIVGIIQWCTQGEGKARPSMKQVLRMLYEGLDPLHSEFAHTIGDDNEDSRYGGFGINKGKPRMSNVIPNSGDGRGLMSSSSTSRSYCSRSFLLESGSPQSPGNFST